MEKSYVDRVKEALVYAPVGAFSFAKDNVPTFFSMFVSRGKRDVVKTTFTAEEKLSSTKEQGQIVAMGTPLLRTRADKIASEAKTKGEEIATMSIDVAASALGFLESVARSLSKVVSDETVKPSTIQTSTPSSVRAAASMPNQNTTQPFDEPLKVSQDQPSFTPESVSDALKKGQGDFIAEPVEVSLPAKIRSEYDKLTAPEIIDRLDDYQKDELEIIRRHEAEFRNRQTIIHAINYRLTDQL